MKQQPTIEQFFHWYENEKPTWQTVLDRAIPCTWLENNALNAAVEHIRLVVRHEKCEEIGMQECFEQHTAWLKNLVVGILNARPKA